DVLRGNRQALDAQYQATTLLEPWLAKWQARVARDAATEPDSRAASMDGVNPVYIPRNHKVEEALAAAHAGDMKAFDALMSVLANPFEERAGLDEYAKPAPRDAGRYRTFCGT
ncbi:MAG: YdiU family protein, partial [Nitratireductor sp.]|nr:YdiU family protein [Nitratireductor sp.]